MEQGVTGLLLYETSLQILGQPAHHTLKDNNTSTTSNYIGVVWRLHNQCSITTLQITRNPSCVSKIGCFPHSFKSRLFLYVQCFFKRYTGMHQYRCNKFKKVLKQNKT